jgi:hypothetical protein
VTEIVQSSLFDYSQLDAETRVTIKQRAERIQERNRTIALNIWENGRDLYEAQQQLAQHGYGCFIEWAESETGFDRRMVYRFISVYEKFDCDNLSQSKIGASALYLLAAPSTPDAVRIEAIEQAQAGKVITHKAAQVMLASSKAAELPPNATRLTLTPPIAPSFLAPKPASTYVSPVAPRPPADVGRSEVRFVPAAPIDIDEYEEMADDGDGEDEDYSEFDTVTITDVSGTQEMITVPGGISGVTEALEIADEVKKNGMAIHYSSESPEHYTPKKIIEAVITVLGTIDLDPCSNSKESPSVPALEHFTVDDDGLSMPWYGRIYMNPPYGRAIGGWTEKLAAEYEAGNVTEAIALVPGRIDTQWWQSLGFRYPACFYTGRLTFIGNDDPAPFPSTIFYLGEDIAKFYEVFSAIGQIWTRIDEHWFTS